MGWVGSFYFSACVINSYFRLPKGKNLTAAAAAAAAATARTMSAAAAAAGGKSRSALWSAARRYRNSSSSSWVARNNNGGPAAATTTTTRWLRSCNATLQRQQQQQQQRQQHLRLPATTRSLATSSSAWDIRQPEKGSGFDNFIPKEDGAKKDDGGSSSDDGKNSTSATNSKKSVKIDLKSSFGGGGGNNNKKNSNNSNNNNAWALVALLLGLAYVINNSNSDKEERSGSSGAAQPSGSSSSPPQREIAWSDLLRLLQNQDIQRIVVSSGGGRGGGDDGAAHSARVYLKPNATGLAHHRRGNSGSFYEHGSDMDATSSTATGGMAATTTISTANGSSTTTSQQQQPPQPAPFYYRLPIGSLDAFERKLDEAERRLGRPPELDVPVQYAADGTVAREVLGAVPGLLLAAALYGMMRFGAGGAGFGASGGGGRGGVGGIFSIGKSTAKKIAKEDVSVTFANVAGCDEAKREIMEFVDFLKDSDRFTKLGAKIPKGALLCGPPGTGKTLLAKAVAGEAGVPFYSISGSDFIEMFVGVGPSRVRDLFSEARQNAPCIVFIDEIDAVGRARGRGGLGGNDERENTLNQLLVEMDGFSPSAGVVVLAGTNRADILDQALTRPGRFDRQITVDKPDLNGRKQIFRVHLKGITLEGDMDDVAGRLAGLTPGFAGADIANICNEAAIVAARRQGETVSIEDFEKATDRIIGGLESNKIMSKEERSIVAHHEAGHAVAGWFLEHADPLLKVTIIPRSSGALGFAQYLPKEVFLRTQDQIMDIVCMALAGRAAEEIFFGRVTTGASDDLKRVTQLVYSTIQLYGMNSRLGQLSFPKDPNAMFEDRPYSEKTAKAMDEEAKAIVDAAYQRTLNLLREKKSELEKVANLLLDKETITHDDLIDLIGPRPFKGDPAYEEFIHRKRQVLGGVTDTDEANKKEESGDETTPPDLNPGLL